MGASLFLAGLLIALASPEPVAICVGIVLMIIGLVLI